MRYDQFAPSPGLPAGIRCIWSLQDDEPAATGPQRVVPDGCVELILNLADPFRHLSGAAPGVVQPAAMIVADARRPMLIAPTGRVDILAIRFEPGGAAQFLGVPMRELLDRSVDLSDVRPALRGLRERVAGCAGTRERVKVAERALARGIAPRLASDRRVLAATRMVVDHGGRVPLDHITRSIGVGSRWLQRRFRESVGFGPKLLGRLTRFHALVAALDSARPGGWARLALSHGYYDQAHLVRDFRAFAGTTPAAYLREPSALNALFGGAG